MNLSNNSKISKNHIHGGHLGVIAIASAVLILFSMMQNGFRFGRASAENEPGAGTALSYEQIRDKVAAAHASQTQQDDNSSLSGQLALIDPSLNQAAVLGATTDISQAIAGVDEVLTRDKLNLVQVKISEQSDEMVLRAYASNYSAALDGLDQQVLLGNLNSADTEALKATSNAALGIVARLHQVAVPRPLAEFHRLSIVYYGTVAVLAESFFTGGLNSGAGSASLIFFNLSNRLEAARREISNKYSVEL